MLSGSSYLEFAEKLSHLSSMKMANQMISKFKDGESRIEINENLKGKRVFVFQSTSPPVAEHYMELFLLLSAVKSEKPEKIIVIMPYLGYSRQDRPTAPGSPISVDLALHLCRESGADQVVTLDLHSKRTLDSFGSFIQNIESSSLLAEKWKKSMPCDFLVCLSPDVGGLFRTQKWAKVLGSSTAFIEKRRSEPNQAQALRLKGCVHGKNVLIIDDIIDTAGTLCTAVDSLIEHGAKDVFTVAVHGLFSGSAIEKIEKSCLKTVWVTNSIKPRKEVLECKKIRIINIEHLFSIQNY